MRAERNGALTESGRALPSCGVRGGGVARHQAYHEPKGAATSRGPDGSGRTGVESRRMPLLKEPRKNEIVQAIKKAGFEPSAFDLTDDGVEFRIDHTQSASCLTLYRDSTWRYVGTHYVGFGPERPFDRSWMTVIPLVAEWLAELRRNRDASDL